MYYRLNESTWFKGHSCKRTWGNDPRSNDLSSMTSKFSILKAINSSTFLISFTKGLSQANYMCIKYISHI